jgi:hypothetical protein
MNLSPVGELVSHHVGSVEPLTEAFQGKSEQEIVRCMFNWIWRGMIVLGIGVVMLVAAKNFVLLKWYNPDIAFWLRTLSTFIILGGTGMSAFGVVNALRQGASLSGGRPKTAIAEPVETKNLPTNPIPPALPSVTERTTQLIPPEATTRVKELK